MKKKQRMWIVLVLAGVCAAGAAAADAPGGRPRVAVLDFYGHNVEAPDAAAVTEFFRTEMVRSRSFEVLDRGHTGALIREMELQQSGLTEQENAVRVGRFLNVDLMAYGSVSRLDDSWFISAGLVEVETSRIRKMARARLERLSDADQAAAVLVRALLDREPVSQEAAKSGRKVQITIPDIATIDITLPDFLPPLAEVIRQIQAERMPPSRDAPRSGTAARAPSPVPRRPVSAPQAAREREDSPHVWHPVSFSFVHPLSTSGFETRPVTTSFSIGVISARSARQIGLGVSGIVNQVDGDAFFLQAAGIGNFTGGAAAGLQAAGIVNRARSLYGIQAGLVNIAHEANGLQAGLVNVAGTLRGVQIGLVNVSSRGGLPFLPIVNIGFAR